MTKLQLICVTVGLILPHFVLANGCDQPAKLRGTDVPYSLWGTCLDFTPMTPEMTLTLGAVVMVPDQIEEIPLVLSVDRSLLTDQFVKDVFDNPRPEVLGVHPLTARGIGLLLTPTALKIKIHSKVVTRLRTELPQDPNYRTFVSDPTFRVESVRGRAFAALDVRRIAAQFPDMYTQYKLPGRELSRTTLQDGRTAIVGAPMTESDLPPRDPPKREN